MDAELVPKPLLFSHFAMLVPFIVRDSPWGMLGLPLLILAAIRKDREVKCPSVSEEAQQHPSPAQNYSRLIYWMFSTLKIYISVYTKLTLFLFFFNFFLWNTCSQVLVDRKKVAFFIFAKAQYKNNSMK